MSSRLFALVVLVLFGAFVVVSCGVRDEGEAVTENVLTAELVVPSSSQVTVEPSTATPEPTATPVPPTATAEPTPEKSQVNISNRGYNLMGSDDAPITMFDFSDFL